MKRSSTVISMILLIIAIIMISEAQAAINPQWWANFHRQSMYDPTLLWWPLHSPLWKMSIFIYFYLAFMGLFNRHDLVVQFFTDYTEVYYPMTGITKI